MEDIKNLKNKTIQKNDNSFVSEGDLLVQKLIADEIKKKYNNYYFISEENDHKEKWKNYNDFIVLDPIDGTDNFISGMKEWGVGISIFKNKEHTESMIFLPDMNVTLKSGDKVSKNKSRIIGMSSRYFKKGLKPCDNNFEYRALGCSMINMYYVITGSFKSYVDTNGGFIWDILPGLNLALENNCEVYVEGEKYNGQFLSPDKRYKLEILNK
jgi:myo-inositol-1(or 4)-monophosphatase|tara:strand:- start:1315 stop:1950 length:636 start_codon:yes stop_codon:yes gene_type:complete